MVKSSNRRTKKKTSVSRSHTKQKGSGLFDMFGDKGAMTGEKAKRYLETHPKLAEATGSEAAKTYFAKQMNRVRTPLHV